MKMNYIEFPRKQKKRKHPLDDIVFTTRVRLSRNIEGFNFPLFLEKERKIQLEDKLLEIISQSYPSLIIKRIEECSSNELLVYLSNRVITSEFIRNGRIFGYSENGELVLLINEEDHIKAYSIETGYNSKNIYRRLMDFFLKLEEKIDFSFDEEFGYLTSSVLNIGTALRISFILNLPGIYYSSKIYELSKDLKEISYSIKPFVDEKSPIFIIFNLFSLGISEEEILEEFENLLTRIMKLEYELRENFIFNNKEELNRILKNIIELKNKQSISYSELVKQVSILDLLNKKIFNVDDIDYIRNLIFKAQDEYLLYKYGVPKDELDNARLFLIKKVLAKLKYRKVFV